MMKINGPTKGQERRRKRSRKEKEKLKSAIDFIHMDHSLAFFDLSI